MKKKVKTGARNKPFSRKLLTILPFAAAVLYFVASLLGIIETIDGWFDPTKPARVLVETVKREPTQRECLRFAFDQLPAGFNLGCINLEVTEISDRKCQATLSARRIREEKASDLAIPSEVFCESAKRRLEFCPSLQADKEGDAFTVEVCPVPTEAGMSARLTVVPTFWSNAKDQISDIVTKMDKGENGAEIYVRPLSVKSHTPVEAR